MNLNTGAVMPMIGFGAGAKNDRTVDAILSAIKIGCRAFDTASMYNTEGLLGEALQMAFKSGLVEREDLFVTTKLSPSDNQPATCFRVFKRASVICSWTMSISIWFIGLRKKLAKVPTNC